MAIAVLLGACSSTDDFFGGRPAPSANPSSGSFADRFRNLFGGSSAATDAPAASTAAIPDDIDCPRVDIRQGASTLMMNAGSSEQSALGLRYQATFGRTARECAVRAGTLSIKVGVQGRVILGPAGSPGDTNLPLRFALVRDGLEPKTLWSKLYTLSVSIPPGQGNVVFTHVEEDLTVPMPSRAELDNYVIYVGFDPDGAPQEKKPDKKKPAPKPKVQRAG